VTVPGCDPPALHFLTNNCPKSLSRKGLGWFAGAARRNPLSYNDLCHFGSNFKDGVDICRYICIMGSIQARSEGDTMVGTMFVIGFIAGAGAMFAMHMLVWEQLKGKSNETDV